MFRSYKSLAGVVGGIILVGLALVGWYVLFVQNPFILLLARVKYNEATAKKMDLSAGPCLGKISDGWVLDIAHLPRQPVDDLPVNQCFDFLSGKVHHFVEMSPTGEVIHVQ